MLGGIEAGGTKFVLAIGAAADSIEAQATIATRTPEETLAEAADWFSASGVDLAAIGIASFGPVQLDRSAPDWGHITSTTKPGWSGCDIAGYFAKRFNVPVGFDTDVNGAALAEYNFGAGHDADSLAYVTVGTGIGGGIVYGGQVVHGAGHPELGHLYPRRPAQDDGFLGNCTFHGDCLEGLASGPAIMRRWGRALSDLPPAHPAHALVAEYLAQTCHSLFAATAVERIVLGGGVMETPGLLDRVAFRTRALGRNYLPGREKQSVVAPALNPVSGLVGAMILAEEALAE